MQHARSRAWILLGCIVASSSVVAARPAAKPAVAAPSKAAPRLTVSATEVKPGDPVLVTVEGVDDRPGGTAGKVSLVFFPVRGGWQAVFATPLEDPPPSIDVKVDKDLTASVTIKPYDFPTETAKVAQELATPPADKHKVVDDDNVAVIDAVRNTEPPRFDGPFRRPGPGMATSRFGAWRTFNGDPHKSRHLGQDFGARLGWPVHAVQRGKVTLVADSFLMGGLVVVVHGAGIASTYFHLVDPKVKVGDEVKAGAILGKVGMTGRTSGPHVHLGLWVPGGFVDPAVFLGLKIRPLRALAERAPPAK